LKASSKAKSKAHTYALKNSYPQPKKLLAPFQSAKSASDRRRIFVVCGTDDEMKQAITNALTKLWLVPVVMCEEPSQGRKIVERFAEYKDVGFAVVLLSPDDFAYAKEDSPTKRRLRPRQDVIFELGFLIGKLGNDHTTSFLQRECANFEWSHRL
jgi:predicted nucleotide-binding protein